MVKESIKKAIQRRTWSRTSKISADKVRRFVKKLPLVPFVGGYVVVIVFGAVMLSILWNTFSKYDPANTVSATPDVMTETTYISPTEGYQFSYPTLWQVTESGDMLLLRNGSHRIGIYTESTVSTETLIPSAPVIEHINNLNTQRYRDYDPATGGIMDRVVIKRPDGRYNELRGYGPVFERILQSFHFADSSN
ncbi:MAG: hypothetical protein WC817_05295 [Patescibacteria group bacterium]|jgi:hypothetical protein